MYKGKYNHTIDAKGRLIIPSKFRDALGDEFVISMGMDGCLFAFDEQGWQSFEQSLNDMPMNKKDIRNLTRFFLAGAADVEVDKQGRILIPAELREFAGLEKDVTLIGVGARIEIWSKERWEAESSELGVEDTLEKLSDWGVSF